MRTPCAEPYSWWSSPAALTNGCDPVAATSPWPGMPRATAHPRAGTVTAELALSDA